MLTPLPKRNITDQSSHLAWHIRGVASKKCDKFCHSWCQLFASSRIPLEVPGTDTIQSPGDTEIRKKDSVFPQQTTIYTFEYSFLFFPPSPRQRFFPSPVM